MQVEYDDDIDQEAQNQTESSSRRGRRHNFSFLQLNQAEMDFHLSKLFFDEEDGDCRISESPNDVEALSFCNNQITRLPAQLPFFRNLRSLDVSSNQLTSLDECILSLRNLASLIAKNNLLDDSSLPKDFGTMDRLVELNLSGNQLQSVPPQIMELDCLRFLYLGGNQISELPGMIGNLQKLSVLYLGGNLLTEVPASVGRLSQLEALILSENQLKSLPPTISLLTKLHTLALHRNCLTTLPTEIVTLRGLRELSLRDNPLVVRFIRDMIYDPPTLLELSARCVKIRNIPFTPTDLPPNLIGYLESARSCENPRCKGVYFDLRVQHIKFVDFCGRYRIPLQQYLCSLRCTASPESISSDSESSEEELNVPVSKLKRVLLG